ncbi:MAG: AbrB/MazE/SpoVT family DNA-binding domain-containing protein [Candidatus Methanoperedens sp.]|nr:AbrB/MazE/SpoVT family DNA-binding domain-containing protein [Candidatus Methanoperedens sp.]
MVERIIKPMTTDGKITIPKELREEYNLKDYVEIVKAKDGILIKAH